MIKTKLIYNALNDLLAVSKPAYKESEIAKFSSTLDMLNNQDMEISSFGEYLLDDYLISPLFEKMILPSQVKIENTLAALDFLKRDSNLRGVDVQSPIDFKHTQEKVYSALRIQLPDTWRKVSDIRVPMLLSDVKDKAGFTINGKLMTINATDPHIVIPLTINVYKEYFYNAVADDVSDSYFRYLIREEKLKK